VPIGIILDSAVVGVVFALWPIIALAYVMNCGGMTYTLG
jgi:hypothetical protein